MNDDGEPINGVEKPTIETIYEPAGPELGPRSSVVDDVDDINEPIYDDINEPIDDNFEDPIDKNVKEPIDDGTRETIEPPTSEDNGSGTNELNEVVEPIEEENDRPPEDELDGFWPRQFKRMARTPWIHLGATLGVSVVLSVLAMTLGGFEATVDNAGWQSRGTLIADRQAQLMLTDFYQDYLFFGGTEVWDDIMTNVQEGWETDGLSTSQGRRLVDSSIGSGGQSTKRRVPLRIDHRLLQESEYLEGCDTSWYTNWTRLEDDTHLWPIWKSESQDTIMDPDLLHDLCVSESNSQAVLESEGLCFGCEDGCLPPFSIVLYARLVIDNGFELECKELSEEWTQYQAETETQFAQCMTDIKSTFDPYLEENDIPESCPTGFSPTLVEETFDKTARMMYSSSIFATSDEDVAQMYEIVDKFDKGTGKITGVYDTQYEDFGSVFTEAAVGRDMALACGSAVVTSLAMLVHTRSPFITGIGLLQIILSFPLAFFVYTFIGGLDFFPFLNFIGVFVVFALGADNVFVATDKWKNARMEHPNASIEYIAAVALSDAAGAMFLTTITTAIAFFGTAICPVAPIKLFAIFCGLLIMFDYIMCVLLVFPALCIYGRRLEAGRSNCCFACHCCHNTEGSSDENDNEEKQSFIRRMLLKFHHGLHRIRWGLLVACAAGFAVSIYFATTLKLPTTADVRIVDPDNEFEQNYAWRQLLFYDALEKRGGSEVMVGFGLAAADTGDLNNPAEWTQLVLDNSFDPASEEAQEFLSSFCPALFEEEFANFPVQNFTCPLDAFGMWLEDQATSTTPEDAYTLNCGGAEGIPMAPMFFEQCMIAWSFLVGDTRVLSVDLEVKIIWFKFASRVRFDSPFDDLDNEWHRIEEWFVSRSSDAPAGVKNSFFSSDDFWWYDTNGQMLSTAYGAAGIALGAAALVILLSSRSFRLTFFAVLTICYVLTSVTATLVGFGWTLGFLESICFAILIGVSVDFVIHFTHSYAHFKGKHSRSERTKHALIVMGPSILAAAFTTMAAATIMLFTIITFFQKFALILLMTIVQATVGSFVVFLTLADCLGPSEPTALFDRIGACFKKKEQETPAASEKPAEIDAKKT